MSDTKYWLDFYNSNKLNNNECSNFCSFIIDFFKNNSDNSDNNIKHILDAGCGNGRDSLFLSKFYKVTAMDNCGFTIENTENLNYINDSFISINKDNYDLIYSRFTFHSINNDEHQQFLASIKDNTYLAIETRSIIGSEINEYYGKTHYRNYTDIEYLKTILKNNNFEILFIKEGKDFAIYKTENPVCIRVICKKNNKL